MKKDGMITNQSGECDIAFRSGFLKKTEKYGRKMYC